MPRHESFSSLAVPPLLSYPRLLSSVIRRPSFDPLLHASPDVFSKIVHPYSCDAFQYFLAKHSLLDAYPDLITFLRDGFPIGAMPNLDTTNILDNHVSTREHDKVIDEYLLDETLAGRLDGPYDLITIQKILRGPFQASPLIVAVQPQAPGEPDKIRVCRHLSKLRRSIASVNSFIKQIPFPTRFDTAVRVAELVSLLLCARLRTLAGPVPSFLRGRVYHCWQRSD